MAGWSSHAGGNKVAGSGSAFTLVITASANVPAGSTVIVALSGTGTIAAAGGSVVDSAGNGPGGKYYLEYAFTSGFRPIEFWRADNVAALTSGTSTFTISYGSTGQTAGITALADVFTAGLGSHDTANGGTVSTSTASCSFTLTATAGDVVLYAAGFVAGAESSMSIASPFTASGVYVDAASSDDSGLGGYDNAPSAGAVTVTVSWPTGHGSNAAAIGLPLAPAGGLLMTAFP